MSAETPRPELSAELAALRAVVALELAMMDYALDRQERELKALRRARHIDYLVASADAANDNPRDLAMNKKIITPDVAHANAMQAVAGLCGCGCVGILLVDRGDAPIAIGKMPPAQMIAFCEDVIRIARETADARRPN